KSGRYKLDFKSVPEDAAYCRFTRYHLPFRAFSFRSVIANGYRGVTCLWESELRQILRDVGEGLGDDFLEYFKQTFGGKRVKSIINEREPLDVVDMLRAYLRNGCFQRSFEGLPEARNVSGSRVQQLETNIVPIRHDF